MSLQTKLEEIRRQPESVRLRYTVVSVAISMFFIGLLWIFSLTTALSEPKGNDYRAVPGAPNVQSSTATSTTEQSNSPTDTATAPSLNDWITK